MIWRDWSDFQRAQVVNGLIIVFFLVGAWRMWGDHNHLWTWIFLAGAAVNIVGGLWRIRQKRRGVHDVEPPTRPNA